MKRFLVQQNVCGDGIGSSNSVKSQVTHKFRKEYSKEWCCLLHFLKSDSHIFCTVCSQNFCVVHCRSDDYHKHMARKIHIDIVKLKDTNKNLTAYTKILGGRKFSNN